MLETGTGATEGTKLYERVTPALSLFGRCTAEKKKRQSHDAYNHNDLQQS